MGSWAPAEARALVGAVAGRALADAVARDLAGAEAVIAAAAAKAKQHAGAQEFRLATRHILKELIGPTATRPA